MKALRVLTPRGYAGPGGPSAPPVITPAAPVVSRRAARADPAVRAAARFEQAQCSWDWRRPLSAHLAAEQALATAGYGTQLAAETDPMSWREEVVAAQQQATCTVSAPHRVVGAPSTSARVYVRMGVSEQVTSTMGSFDGGDRVASWLVQRIEGRWLVAGTFDGG